LQFHGGSISRISFIHVVVIAPPLTQLRRNHRAEALNDVTPAAAVAARRREIRTAGRMLIVVNKESCMLLPQRRAEPWKRLHLYRRSVREAQTHLEPLTFSSALASRPIIDLLPPAPSGPLSAAMSYNAQARAIFENSHANIQRRKNEGAGSPTVWDARKMPPSANRR